MFDNKTNQILNIVLSVIGGNENGSRSGGGEKVKLV